MFLLYYHGRNVFTGPNFKPGIKKWFKDVQFEGFEFGNYTPVIKVSNYEEVKAKLPKSYRPLCVGESYEIVMDIYSKMKFD